MYLMYIIYLPGSPIMLAKQIFFKGIRPCVCVGLSARKINQYSSEIDITWQGYMASRIIIYSGF